MAIGEIALVETAWSLSHKEAHGPLTGRGWHLTEVARAVFLFGGSTNSYDAEWHATKARGRRCLGLFSLHHLRNSFSPRSQTKFD